MEDHGSSVLHVLVIRFHYVDTLGRYFTISTANKNWIWSLRDFGIFMVCKLTTVHPSIFAKVQTVTLVCILASKARRNFIFDQDKKRRRRRRRVLPRQLIISFDVLLKKKGNSTTEIIRTYLMFNKMFLTSSFCAAHDNPSNKYWYDSRRRHLWSRFFLFLA